MLQDILERGGGSGNREARDLTIYNTEVAIRD